MERLGVYGGTFDPVHRGHLAVARAVKEAHGLDRVLLVPAARPPHKRRDLAPGPERLAMLRLATRDEAGIEPSDIELRRGGVSYTVETLRELRRERPDAELFFIIGADSVPELRGWKSVPQILDLARLVTVNRPGHEARFDPADFPGVPEDTVRRLARDRVTMEPSPVSSTEIRRRAREGESLEDLVPPGVGRYIREHGLYRPPAAAEPSGGAR